MARALRPPPLLVALAGLLGAAAAAAPPPAASTLLLRQRRQGRRAGDAPELVASLKEVVEGLEAEQSKGKALLKERQLGCAGASKNLSSAISRGKRTELEAQEDLRSADAEVSSLQASVDGLATQLSEAADKIKGLTQRLKELRGNQSQMEEQSEMSLRQVEEVIAKAYLRERGLGRHRRAAAPGGPAAVEVADLQRLGSQLFESSPSAGQTAPSLLELGTVHGQRGRRGRGVTGALRADKEAMLKAKVEAMKGFDEEEKELIDLIKIERERLKALQESLDNQQPVLANKLKESAQANRTLSMARRGLSRDRGLLEASRQACELMDSAMGSENTLRFQAINLVKMPTVIIAKMDTTAFLAGDLQRFRQRPAQTAPGGRAASFLQLGAEVAPAAPAALLEEEASGSAGSTQSALGPFDKVSEMIQALISSLQEQANEDVDRHQWCLESKAANEREVLATNTALDTAQSEIHWAETAIASLEEQIAAAKAEAVRLEQAAATAPQELAAETARLSAQASDHNVSKEIVSKVLVVLGDICDLDDNVTGVLLQRNRSSGRRQSSPNGAAAALASAHAAVSSGRRGQCAEAAQLLGAATAKIGELDQAATEYLAKCQQLAASAASSATVAASERGSELAAARAARAKRAMDLAAAKEALKNKQRDHSLLQEAEKQLQRSCGPQAETREERIRRRNEEIEALRSALSVLEGEAAPI